MMGTAAVNRRMALLARLVDAAGEPIRPADVASIEYSVYELDANCRGGRAVVAGLEAVEVAVGYVVLDVLETDEPWQVDDVGYNFRHEMELGWLSLGEFGPPRLVVEYVVTPVGGSPVRVRFDLGMK